jgi:hypothetical protein
VTASPALGAVAVANSDVDVIIVGAGRRHLPRRRVSVAGRSFRLIEPAADWRRCVTDMNTLACPTIVAHWIRMPEINPVVKLARKSEFDVYAAPPSQRLA